MAIYAIKLNNDWVELREAVRPPVKNTSRVMREIKVPPSLALNLGVASPVLVELKNTSFNGGKPLLTISRTSLTALRRKLDPFIDVSPRLEEVLDLKTTRTKVLEVLKESKLTYYPTV